MKHPFRLWRKGRGCCLAIALLLILVLLGTCIAAGFGAGKALAQDEQRGMDVMLVLDQSNSLWEMGGVGSDPQMLRMEGARLFSAYLGVDSAAREYRLGAVYFGTRPELIAPLAPVMDSASRTRLAAILEREPRPMGWTDVNAALAVGYRELFESERAEATHAAALVLFTDGRPETGDLDTPAANAAYLAGLQEWVQRFTDRGTAIFTVLLSSAATDADPQIRDTYRPLWVDLAESGVGVRFYEARGSQDLADIYHDIVVQIHRGLSQGVVLDRAISGSITSTFQVPDGWQRASLVVRTSDARTEIAIRRPDGSVIQVGEPGVRYAGGPAHYQVWTIDRPVSGVWTVQARGQGVVTVWLDYQPAAPRATPTATNTAMPTTTSTDAPAPALMLTPSPTLLPTPMPSASPAVSRDVAATSIWPTAIGGAVSRDMDGRSPHHSGWQLAVAAAAIVLAVAGTYLWRRGRRLLVEGNLCLVQGPDGEPSQPGQVWDLHKIGRETITLGRAAGCEVHLAHGLDTPPRAAVICARRDGQGRAAPVLTDLSGTALVLVHGQPVGQGRQLEDGDVIQVGSYRLRYRNLALRVQALAWQPQRSR